MEKIMSNSETPHVITPQEIEDKLRKLPYTKEELLDWERWGNDTFGYPERKR
jgi:hypothetical protein